MSHPTVTEADVRSFWNSHPCGDYQVEGLRADYEAFFDRYDAFRYSHEAHILKRLDAIDWKGKRVLEIGLGQGADAEQIIRRGGLWSGLDLTPESVERVTARLKLKGLPYDNIKVGSALAIPYDAGSFDIVFSHGVLHHIPEVRKAQAEIARVLKPGGELIAMLYARRSLNYLLSIALVRRLALLLAYAGGVRGSGMLGEHLAQARRQGLLSYLRMSNFIHRNTDGPLNPYSKVYDLASVRQDFPGFALKRAYRDFMHAPPLPVKLFKPLAGLLGWHLWVHMTPRRS